MIFRTRPFKWCVSIQNSVGALIFHFSALDNGLLFMVSPNLWILLSLKYDFWWHHFNYFFLRFKKIQKKLTLDPRNSSYGSWKIPKPSDRGGCSWTSFNSHNLSIVDPMSKFLWFSESLGRDLSNDVLKSNIFVRGPNLLFFGLGPWYRQIDKYFLSLKYELWWHYLKGLFLSFQKIKKSLILDPRNSS